VNCTQARRHFGAFWDDELTQAEREWLEAHFAACPGCRAEYESLAHTIEALGKLPRVEVTPGLAARALAKARRTTPAPDRLPAAERPRWIAVAAAAALIATVGTTVLQWSSVSIAPRPLARREGPAVRQPVLVTPPAATARVETPAPTLTDPVASAVSDSLFDPNADIEFILDPVTLRKGRAHPASRLAPEQTRGEQAVITF
jgi:predicted anti-sigma-YlaC factor YlaD